MLSAVVFGLLFVLIFHLVKRQLSKSQGVKQETVSQPMSRIEIQQVGASRSSLRYFHPKSPYVRIPLTQKERFFILRRDNFTCQYCKHTDRPLEVDHIISVFDGGTNDPSNLI